MREQGVEQVDCVVIGAGIVGLAAARALALAGREVLVLEAGDAIGGGISSRNSEVIHAGMYYPAGTLKAKLCVAGNRLLRQFADTHGVPYRMCGKLIVAIGAEEEAKLADILAKGHVNGVDGLSLLSAAQAQALEPAVRCSAALLSAATGIIDTHALMLALQGVMENHGGALALRAPVSGGAIDGDGILLRVGGVEPMCLRARSLVIAAGLHSCAVARSLGLTGVPSDYLCKGNYFNLTGKMAFSRLVYPVPVDAGLGVHYTLDMAGQGRFGPDVEWVEAQDYAVDPGRAALFYEAIRRYWPALPDGALAPGYAGIRPKISAKGEPAADFLVHGPDHHGGAAIVALYGIESPGLTSSLALAQLVAELLA